MDGPRAVASRDAPATPIAPEGKTPVLELLSEFARAVGQGDPAAHDYLLLLRFLLANVVALALVGAAAGQGWIGMIFKADTGVYSLAIVAVFLVGLAWSAQRALQISRELNVIKRLESRPRAAPVPAPERRT